MNVSGRDEEAAILAVIENDQRLREMITDSLGGIEVWVRAVYLAAKPVIRQNTLNEAIEAAGHMGGPYGKSDLIQYLRELRDGLRR